MKNIALALNAYQLRHEVLPASYRSEFGHSFVSYILPDLDQPLLYNEYNFSRPNWAEENRRVVETRMMILRCPDGLTWESPSATDMRTSLDQGQSDTPRFASSHYAANWGGGLNGWGQDFVMKHGRDRGVMMENRGVASKEITDGRSTTVFVGERTAAHGWAVGGWGASEFDVGPGPIYSGNSRIDQLIYTGVDHPNGTNFAFCDGSVRVLTNEIHQAVWYALITRNGGEKIADDFDQ